MDLRNIESLDITNKKILLRLDLNVPLDGQTITDDTRIMAALPTIKYILEKTPYLAIMSHLGRPKGSPDPKYSLAAVGEKLSHLLEREIAMVESYGDDTTNLGNLFSQIKSKQIVLLENLRFFKGETENDQDFSRNLIKGFDFYINDAFGTCHRAHSSVVGVTKFIDKDRIAAGFLIEKEIKALSPLVLSPKAPFSVIMGGSKVSDKIGIILRLLEKCNHLLIGGAMAYTFLQYKKFNVGSSRVETDKFDLVEMIYSNAEKRNVKIEIPEDHIAATEFNENAEPISIPTPEIPEGHMGLDIGEKTAKKYQKIIKSSQTVLWNGPMGVFEWNSFSKGSLAVAKAIKECEGQTIIGGGDSVSCAKLAKIEDYVSHISTGGGASLEYLEGKSLPGIKVLTK